MSYYLLAIVFFKLNYRLFLIYINFGFINLDTFLRLTWLLFLCTAIVFFGKLLSFDWFVIKINIKMRTNIIKNLFIFILFFELLLQLTIIGNFTFYKFDLLTISFHLQQ